MDGLIKLIPYDSLNDKTYFEAQHVPHSSRKWEGIIIHATVVPSYSAVPKQAAALIDESHRNYRGWKHGMGYHFIINGDGDVEYAERWAKQLPGAHARGHNSTWIGIGIVFNGDVEFPTHEQKRGLYLLTRNLLNVYANITKLRFHRDFTDKKTCPGKLIKHTDALCWVVDLFDIFPHKDLNIFGFSRIHENQKN